MYNFVRHRRNRKSSWIRDLTSETSLSPKDLILPLFVIEGEERRESIGSMPGVYRYSVDQILLTAKKASEAGIKAIALFPVVDPELKSEGADEAYNLDNLACRTIRRLKNSGIDIGIICDVALDPYTTHGHDGILEGGDVDNDKTVEALKNQALVLAKAGADVVAPSDMMDGRVFAIREELDSEGFIKVNIFSYSVKYASAFYGPFRDALNNSDRNLNKSTYHMDYRNSGEALREIESDIDEGADAIIIKPGMPYLDVIKEASQNFDLPIFAYQVSGEYSALKFAAASGALDFDSVLMESLICLKRGGARAIISYGAIEAAEILNKSK